MTLSPAAAAPFATLTFTSRSFTLTDLAPNDGIATSLILVPTFGSNGFVEANALEWGPYAYDGGFEQSQRAFQEMHTDAATTHVTSGAAITGSSLTDLAATVSTSIAGGPDLRQGSARAFTRIEGFVLSPHTAVTFFADIVATAFTDSGAGLQTSTAAISLFDFDWDYTSVTARASWTPDAMGGGQWLGETVQAVKTVRLDYSNTRDQAATLSFGFEALTNVEAAMSPIPEPTSLAMLMSGLMMLGAAAHRRHTSYR